MNKTNDQELVNLCFSMVLAATDNKIFCKRPRGERMAWVANQLRSMGYDTTPVGMSWGMLVSPELRETLGPLRLKILITNYDTTRINRSNKSSN
jgi:hypothetical protein